MHAHSLPSPSPQSTKMLAVCFQLLKSLPFNVLSSYICVQRVRSYILYGLIAEIFYAKGVENKKEKESSERAS